MRMIGTKYRDISDGDYMSCWEGKELLLDKIRWIGVLLKREKID